MCGIFGTISPRGLTTAATSALHALGLLAVERGQDSAGLARIERDSAAYVKGFGQFGDVVTAAAAGRFEGASTVLGHTRWATQGAVEVMANVSPMPVGHLIGTHNGDVAMSSIPTLRTLPAPAGTTDTERLYQAIAAAPDVDGILAILRQVQGRLALAWTDSRVPERLYLARGSMSPLATTLDQDGNLWWASNPDWFRQLDRSGHGRGFVEPTLVPEGTFLEVDRTTAQVVARHEFQARCRRQDERLTMAAWRGFTAADREADRSALRHVLVDERPKSAWAGPQWSDPAWTLPVSQEPVDDPDEDVDVDELLDAAAEWHERWLDAGRPSWMVQEVAEVQAALREAGPGATEVEVFLATWGLPSVDAIAAIDDLLDEDRYAMGA